PEGRWSWPSPPVTSSTLLPWRARRVGLPPVRQSRRAPPGPRGPSLLPEDREVVMNSPKLSIVIPAYNEAGRLPASLDRIIAYCDAREVDFELLVVDDGSTDDTAGVAEAIVHRLGERG